ncbi:histone-lysine N-methyltransferase SETMAR [Trichonephila clavipes]|nr:histone-lysine N-methyltransferase SETMAR [Trichonephila clavipes]
MRSARDQSPSLPIDVLGISLQRVPHVEAWRVGCYLSSPPRHSTGVPNDTVCIITGLIKAIKLEGQKIVTANWYTTKCLPKILQEVNFWGLMIHHDSASSHTAGLTATLLKQ